ncbi:MAG TPA: DUF4199 domain-containing protein [Candidatus Polarisedimenticolaceae bacterium]|nr:DUF4199 domain-containing protein [Candidatus Polarisedimenticolaceae bacterium]
MRRTVLTYGLISGILSAVMMLATLPFLEEMGGSKGYIVGYTAILAAAMLIFFGIRSYRENVGGGKITFGRGFAVGILICLISCAFYVATWQTLYFGVMPELGDKLEASMVKQAAAGAATPAEAAVAVQRAHDMKRQLDNPVISSAFVFLEPFPVGLLVTLISAAILRRK